MKKIYYTFILIFPLFLLTSCQKEENFTAPPAKKNQNAEIQKCLSWNEVKAQQSFGYLDQQFNNAEKSGWYREGEIKKEENVYMSLSEWSNEGVRRIVLENSSPSGDWYRIDAYCFNENGEIAELYSDLRTSYGDVQVIKNWEYYTDGSVKNTDIEVKDIKTQKTINPDEANYMDNPPYIAKSYKDLASHFKFPDLGS